MRDTFAIGCELAPRLKDTLYSHIIHVLYFPYAFDTSHARPSSCFCGLISGGIVEVQRYGDLPAIGADIARVVSMLGGIIFAQHDFHIGIAEFAFGRIITVSEKV